MFSMTRHKSQVIGEVFVYILAVVLFSLIMIYGYNAIRNLGDKADRVVILQIEKDLKSSVKKIASDYGTIIKKEVTIPNQYNKVCFIDVSYTGQASTNICITGNEDYNAIMCNSWKDRIQKNMFLLSKNQEAFSIDIGSVRIPSTHYFCQDVAFAKITLKLEGKGSHTELSPWDN